MKNDFRENGRMAIRFETPEERAGIIRILEEQCGIRIDEKLKQSGVIDPNDTRTFVINLKSRSFEYCIRPLIGAAMLSSGIRFYSAEEFFRIAELDFRVVPRFPVFHIPHTGEEFPREMMHSVCVPEETFRRYHTLMSDKEVWQFVPEAYYGGDMTERFRISRLMCDVERFIGPEEEMEEYGMGFCYEKAYDGTVIKTVTEELKEQARKYYDEHPCADEPALRTAPADSAVRSAQLFGGDAAGAYPEKGGAAAGRLYRRGREIYAGRAVPAD